MSDTIKPGTEVTKDTKLYVKDSKGNTIGEINVKAGNKVPPSRLSGASTYSTKK